MKMNEKDEYIIEQYKNDEEMMILIYTQWCINNDFDPEELYQLAYPNQQKNPALLEAIQKTVEKNESEEISHQLVQQVLQLFGNDDLAFVVQQKIDQLKKK
ncbi:hypothetical protein ACFSKI_04670 [Pseudogracilibacillus auburnensis]|uniref:Uncharacterized protein n=1 Tax=Pseudogracilibacillus auburnensis TaxID=1494959 RepID=A0A2V3VW49_9BACI|nr:hypothetical protein [Pseudogracilibacillus auburnensis]PXW86213.1 hypothetical protein DFR56_10826 [Pseudogracilibacillus auburnensis]